MRLIELQEALGQHFVQDIIKLSVEQDELILIIPPQSLLKIAEILRDTLQFEQLSDLIGIDYSTFGIDEWETQSATFRGFSRGVEQNTRHTHVGSRFGVAYQLLSYAHNIRLRLKVFLHDEWPEVDSVAHIWPAANWFEREAFDLFGIIFRNHPDLRRILTDYGFIGHPFRKDFPLIGQVEMRYDATENRVIYDEVEIEPRTLVPRVIRKDNRYSEPENV